MKSIAIVVCLLLSGVATAGTDKPVNDDKAEPATGAPAAPTTPPPAAAPTVQDAKAACAQAMNADPNFARSIELTIDKQLDQQTIDAHEDAFHHIQKNENHVIYAYAAMWVIAALLVGFLFLRQQALKTEILALKRDLAKAEDKS